MGIKYTRKPAYRVFCDECGLDGARRVSEEAAREVAEVRDGWIRIQASGDPGADMKDLCFVCRGEWEQDNIKLNTAGAQAGRKKMLEPEAHRKWLRAQKTAAIRSVLHFLFDYRQRLADMMPIELNHAQRYRRAGRYLRKDQGE